MIRVATPADEDALTRLQSLLPEPSPALLERALATAAPAPATVLVSTAEDAVVGYLLAVPGDDTAYVAELVVAPAHRREGRARALLERCAERADTLTVTVAPDNEAAQSLYRACGFERVQRLPDFFENGAAIQYRRE